MILKFRNKKILSSLKLALWVNLYSTKTHCMSARPNFFGAFQPTSNFLQASSYHALKAKNYLGKERYCLHRQIMYGKVKEIIMKNGGERMASQ